MLLRNVFSRTETRPVREKQIVQGNDLHFIYILLYILLFCVIFTTLLTGSATN